MFSDCNQLNETPVGNGDDTDLWLDAGEPLVDPNNNNNNPNINGSQVIYNSKQEYQLDNATDSADDLLFDTGYIIESLVNHRGDGVGRVDNGAYLKTTHVTGHGVSCEVVSEVLTRVVQGLGQIVVDN